MRYISFINQESCYDHAFHDPIRNVGIESK